MKAHKTLHGWGHNITEAYDVKYFMHKSPRCIISAMFGGDIISGASVRHITIAARGVVDVYGCKIKS